MEGVRLFTAEELPCGVDGDVTSPECIGFIRNDLQETLGGMVKTIFGDNIEMRWVDAFFPFTEPGLQNQSLKLASAKPIRLDSVVCETSYREHFQKMTL